MAGKDRLQFVRDAYGAYETGDRDALEELLADALVFHSPADPGIDRTTYFERCWPNSDTIESFEFVRKVERSPGSRSTSDGTSSSGGQADQYPYGGY